MRNIQMAPASRSEMHRRTSRSFRNAAAPSGLLFQLDQHYTAVAPCIVQEFDVDRLAMPFEGNPANSLPLVESGEDPDLLLEGRVGSDDGRGMLVALSSRAGRPPATAIAYNQLASEGCPKADPVCRGPIAGNTGVQRAGHPRSGRTDAIGLLLLLDARPLSQCAPAADA